MSNMSYCRFHNTRIDLEDCLCALEDGEELSSSEMACCKQMFNRFINFCCHNGIIEDDSELDDRLKEFFNMIGKPEYW